MLNFVIFFVLSYAFCFAMDLELKEKNIPQIEKIFKRYFLKEGIKRDAVVGLEAGSLAGSFFAMQRLLGSKLPQSYKVGSILAGCMVALFLEYQNYLYHYELASTQDINKFFLERRFFGPNYTEIFAERLVLIKDNILPAYVTDIKKNNSFFGDLKTVLATHGEKGNKLILAFDNSEKVLNDKNLDLNDTALRLEKKLSDKEKENSVTNEDSGSKEEKSIKEVDEIYDFFLKNFSEMRNSSSKSEEELCNFIEKQEKEIDPKIYSLSESAYQQLLSLFNCSKKLKFRSLCEKETINISENCLDDQQFKELFCLDALFGIKGIRNKILITDQKLDLNKI